MAPTLDSDCALAEAAHNEDLLKAMEFKCTVSDPLRYALRKRQMLLDAEPSLGEQTVLQEIIRGLPEQVQPALFVNTYSSFHDFTSDLIRIDLGAFQE